MRLILLAVATAFLTLGAAVVVDALWLPTLGNLGVGFLLLQGGLWVGVLAKQAGRA